VHCSTNCATVVGCVPRPRAWSAELLVGPCNITEGVFGILPVETYGGRCLKGMKSQRGTETQPASRGFAPRAAGMNAP
jgi:hypothetical protein